MRLSVPALVALGLAFLSGGAVAQEAPVASLAEGRSGKISFESQTPTSWFSFLRREATIPKTLVVGTLRFPETAVGRVPAMIIAHGSGGITDDREFWWAGQMTGIGVAAFVVDSFGPRGITQTATDQGQLSNAANVSDAFAALRLLATHPRIDPARIGIMGFSRGGQVALFTSLEPYRRAALEDAATKFAAHVALYPACNDWHMTEKLAGGPMLFLLGGQDDYTPAQACREFADWFRSRGAAATVIVYPNASHAFDSHRRVVTLPNVVTGRDCAGAIDLDRFRVTDRKTGKDVTRTVRDYYRGCMSRGASLGGDVEARTRAPQDVKAFLKMVFKL